MSAGGGAGAGAVVRQGHLRKLKTMKKKYFVLRSESAESSARLDYYESEKKYRAGAPPRRVLPLKSCYNITRRLDLKQKHVIALFTREEQFCVVAENEQELHSWLSAILQQHTSDEHSDELLHPIQHVWQVNVQKKGLGASKNIQGLYNLCLTDKTLTLVKIKSHNNVISDLGIPERVEYSLKNIRRCGDSECFFYMEVGRQTATGAGELWMHTDDSNIAQSMHSTIYHAMRNCAKETENEKDHIVMPKGEGTNPLPARRQTFSDSSRGRVGLSNAENQPPNNSLINDKPDHPRLIKHHRTVSLPTGCPLFHEPLKIVHERTRSAPLTGDEVDRVTIERAARHASCKAVNGTDTAKKPQWSRRASTGARLYKLSPAHTKNAAGTFRNRCDSMPSRACTSLEVERPPARHTELIEGLDGSRDEPDSVAEWHRTPRIPEEPDYCEMGPRDLFSKLARESAQHSRTSSLAASETSPEGADGLPPAPDHLPMAPDGYLPMAPLDHGLVSASSGSVCSGTPSTDPRFSEYQLEPATSHIVEDERPPRAYSVGSRPAPARPDGARLRAYRYTSLDIGSVLCRSEYQLEPATSHIVEDERPPRAYSVGSRPAPARPDGARLRAYRYTSLDIGSVLCRSEYQLEPATSHIVEDERPPRAYSVGSRPAPARPDGARLRAYRYTSLDIGSVLCRSEYQLEPATSHIVEDERPPRAYSVGSRPAPARPDGARLRAYSVGAHNRAAAGGTPRSGARASSSAPLLPRASAEDLMELDFSHPPTPHPAKVIVSRTPPSAGFMHPRMRATRTRDEESAGYVEMRPGAGALGLSPPRPAMHAPDGYVEMSLGSRTPLRAAALAAPPAPPDTQFPLTLEASPDEHGEPDRASAEHHPLTTLREISEECARKSPELSSSPSYVALSRQGSRVDPPPNSKDGPIVVKASGLHYAALDLEPRAAGAPHAPRVYTQIDFLRSEKLAADN